MEEQLEIIIKKIIFKKFPSLFRVSVKDLMGDWYSVSKTSYICRFDSDECLSSKEQMEIDTEVKLLFTMVNVPTKSFRKPSIFCFFDCGQGYEFHSEYGYKH
jgi:hypothetical protein